MANTAAAYEALRESAKAVKPPQELKPNRYWIAILFEDRNPSEVSGQADFLWVKGNRRTTIANVHTEYQKRKPGDFRLHLGPDVPKDTDSMVDLNKFDDRLIVLLPVRPSASASSSMAARGSTTPRSSPPPMIKPEPDQARPQAPPSGIANQPHPFSTQASPLHTTMARPSQMPTEHSEVPASSPHLAGWSSPSHQYQLPPSSSALPGSPDSPNIPHKQQRMNGSPYMNDPRIMGVFHVAQSHQYPWLNNYAPQPSAHAAPPPPQRHKSVNTHMARVSPQSCASPLAPAHPQVSTLNNSALSSTTWNSSVSEHQTVSPAPSERVKAKPQNPFLQQLSSETNPEKLEKGVEKAIDLLKELQARLDDDQTESRDAAQWLQSIEDVKKEAVRSRTVIGVVGNTGAGKSSVINALLDEERLVPTNCMRACTAVVTELSYNDSEDEQSRFKADVEFIKLEDWHKELVTLFDDLLDGSGRIAKETSNPDSEAGIAFAKIHAVYPNKTKDQLAAGGIEALMRDAAVNRILGTTKKLEDYDSLKFYQKLQTYVDSQEKATGRPKKDEIRRMEYWPLIKVVKIYTKADVLSTGAVLVDLPGVHDSNAARAAVADGYMKQCTGLWIVAPITRAVDDKAAKTLLGDSFKRQLKLDGTYDNVTFICSKTDDISIQEAVLSLNLDETAERSWQESDEMRNQVEKLKERLNECKEAKEVFSGIIDDCDDQLEVWDKLDDDLADGKTVYALSQKKRKRPSDKSRSQKRRRTEDSDDDFIDDDSQASAASASEPETEDEDEDQQPLTSEDVEAKKHELRTQKKNAKDERGDLDQKMKDLRREIKQLNEKIATIDHMISALCIKGRNDYSRGAIQQDFAAGIKELDQETAIEEDEEHFDPDQELRDYDEVARSLPVFCISSPAFQKLSGRLKRDKTVPGFENVNETEMPQLKAHCKKLTEAGRAASSRKFLNNMSQLLNSMSLWASNSANGSQLTAGQQQREAQFLEQKLIELHRGLSEVVDDTLSSINDGLTQNIYAKYDRAIKNASDASLPTAEKWGRQRTEGGLHFSTYRATVRRNGAYTSASAGPRDFNGELAEPMIKQIATGWERTFQRILPGQLDRFKTKTLEVLKSFHDTVTRRANEIGVSIAAITALSGQLQNYEPFLEAQVRTIKEMMTIFQREVNREFTPKVAAAMEHAYEMCSAERGPGCYVRMKAHMTSHVSRNHTEMFQVACNEVRKRLEELSQTIKGALATRAQGIHSTAERDYLTVLGNIGTTGVPASQVGVGLKSAVANILEDGETIFRGLVEGTDDEIEAQNEQNEDMNADNDEHSGMNDADQISETEERVRQVPSDASEASRHWETDDTLIGSVLDDKENSPVVGKAVSQKNSETVTAEATVLQSLDTNI